MIQRLFFPPTPDPEEVVTFNGKRLGEAYSSRGSDMMDPIAPVINDPPADQTVKSEGSGVSMNITPQPLEPAPSRSSGNMIAPQQTPPDALSQIAPAGSPAPPAPPDYNRRGIAPQARSVAPAPPASSDVRISPFASTEGAFEAGVPEMPTGEAEGIAPQLPASQMTQNQINDIYAKDYSKAIYRNPETGETSSRMKPGYVLEKERGKDRDKNWSVGDKVVSSVIGFLQGLGQTGNLIGGAAGAVRAGTNRNFMEQQGDNENLARLVPQANQQRQAEQFQSNMAQAERKARMDEQAIGARALENLRLKNKPLYDAILADDMVTEEESARLKESGYDVPPYDARRFDRVPIEGDIFERPQKGQHPWEETNLPTERVKVPVNVTQKNPDGTEVSVPMLPQTAADFAYRSQKDKAAAEARAAEIERRKREKEEGERDRREESNFKSVREWETAQRKARAQIKSHQKIIERLDRSIAEVNAQIERYQGSYDVSDLQKTRQSLEKQRAEYEGKIIESEAVLQTPKPKVFTPSSKRNQRRKRTYNQSDIERIIRQ